MTPARAQTFGTVQYHRTNFIFSPTNVLASNFVSGTNIILYRDALQRLVINSAAAGGGGSTNAGNTNAFNPLQFITNSGVISLVKAARQTNAAFWGAGTNHGDFYIDTLHSLIFTNLKYITENANALLFVDTSGTAISIGLSSIFLNRPLVTPSGFWTQSGVTNDGNYIQTGVTPSRGAIFDSLKQLTNEPSTFLVNISGTGAITNVVNGSTNGPGWIGLLSASNNNVAVIKTLTASGAATITDQGTNIDISTSAGVGEVNVNGEISVTNATQFGWVYDKSDVTNRLRSLQPGYGMIVTNEGTNLVVASLPLWQGQSLVLSNLSTTGAITNIVNDSTNTLGGWRDRVAGTRSLLGETNAGTARVRTISEGYGLSLQDNTTNHVLSTVNRKGSMWAWGSSNVQWRMVKNGTLSGVTDTSACAFYPSNNTFFTIHNNNGTIREWNMDGGIVRTITISGTGGSDMESITWLGRNQFAAVNEDDNLIYVMTITNNTTWATNNCTLIKLSASIGVDAPSGVEGIAFDHDRDGWWVVREKTPAQLLFVSADGSVTNNYFSSAVMATLTNANNTDFSDIYLDRESQVLWITQDEGGQFDRVLALSLITSNVIHTVACTNFGQLEGVSLTPDGNLLVVGEVNQYAMFEPVLGGVNSGITWLPNALTNQPSVPHYPFGASAATYLAQSNVTASRAAIYNAAKQLTNEPSTLLFNISGTGAITNFVSLSTTNALSKPLTNRLVNGLLEMFGLEGGANITLTPNETNIVIAATGGSGEVNIGGDAGLTNSTRIGLAHSKAGVTNYTRTVQAGYGAALTNEGTNIMFALSEVLLTNANTLWVRVDGSDSTGRRGRFDRPFATVGAAVTAALTNDIVIVGPGIFTVASTITLNGVRLYGSGIGATILSHGSVDPCVDLVTAAEVADMTLDGTGQNITVTPGTDLVGTNIFITRVHCNSSQECLAFNGTPLSTSADVELCYFNSTSGSGAATTGVHSNGVARFINCRLVGQAAIRTLAGQGAGSNYLFGCTIVGRSSNTGAIYTDIGTVTAVDCIIQPFGALHIHVIDLNHFNIGSLGATVNVAYCLYPTNGVHVAANSAFNTIDTASIKWSLRASTGLNAFQLTNDNDVISVLQFANLTNSTLYSATGNLFFALAYSNSSASIGPHLFLEKHKNPEITAGATLGSITWAGAVTNDAKVVPGARITAEALEDFNDDVATSFLEFTTPNTADDALLQRLKIDYRGISVPQTGHFNHLIITNAPTFLNGGVGETNFNGEVSVTNATMFGLVNGKAGVTNLLRSIAARNGLVGTNESGTNISLAIDPAVVASQANLTAASNSLVSEIITASNNVYTTETTRNAAVSNALITYAISVTNSASVTNWINSRQPADAVLSNLVGTVARNVTNLVSLSISNATSKPLTNSFTDGVVKVYGLQAGANITTTPNASNIVVAFDGTGGVSADNFNDGGFGGDLVLVSVVTAIEESATTATELGYLNNVTSDLQEQLNAKVDELAGVATNLTARSLTVATNLVYTYTTETIATNSTANSNLVVALSVTAGAGTRELFLTNDISITNFTGMAAGTQATAHWRIMPTGKNRTVVWPGAGASLGIYRWTNSASTLWTTLTNGVQYRFAAEAWDTNINLTISAYQ